MNQIGAKLFTAALLALPLALMSPARAVPINQPVASPDDGLTAPSPDNEPRFTNVIEDLPLMPGLQLVEDEDVLFAEPGVGRIAETNAIGPVAVLDVYKFYHHSLPHLGWKAVDTRTYIRQGERLRIDAQANQKITTVRFTVKPTANP